MTQKMRRLFAFGIMILVFSMTAGAQLLYKISGNGLKNPSFVLGTYHLAPSSFTDSIPGFKASFDATTQVCGEIVEDDMMKQEEMAKLQAAMMLPDSMTIQKMLTEEEMTALNALTKELMGVDFTNPLVGGQLGKMTPNALSTQFTLMMYLKNTPDFDVTNAIDYYVQALGSKTGKKVMGLESVDDQILALFKSQTLERQKVLLMCMVNNKDYYLQQSEDLTKAYFTQDLDELEKITDMKFDDQCDNTDEETAILISNRNENWMQKMPAIMSEAPTFFAVGAAHLTGEKGVLQLLREAGYQVQPVK